MASVLIFICTYSIFAYVVNLCVYHILILVTFSLIAEMVHAVL